VKRTVLQQRDIPGAADKEATLILAEIAPGGAAGRHFHPGPEVGYVIEGTLLLEIDGRPPLTIKAGDSFISESLLAQRQNVSSCRDETNRCATISLRFGLKTTSKENSSGSCPALPSQSKWRPLP
jgi:hypothetical protein